METDYKNSLAYKAAKKRVKDIKGFYLHLTVYLFINIVIFFVTTRDSGWMNGLDDISNFFTAFFWGIGLAAHWVSVFGPNIVFGKKWEERKIKEIMDKDQRKI